MVGWNRLARQSHLWRLVQSVICIALIVLRPSMQKASIRQGNGFTSSEQAIHEWLHHMLGNQTAIAMTWATFIVAKWLLIGMHNGVFHRDLDERCNRVDPCHHWLTVGNLNRHSFIDAFLHQAMSPIGII